MSARLTPSVLSAVFSFLLLAPAAGARDLDEGLLQSSWFGGDLEWHRAEEIDYLWVKDGFSLQGKTVHVADWQEPEFLHKKDRDTKDSARAYELTETMPDWLRGALTSSLSGTAEVSRESGDVLLEGRFVDVNAGSKAAKWLVGFGAGSATATWDLKLVDAQTGELLAAIHHRAVSGTNISDIDDKIIKWLDEALVPAVNAGLEQTYAGGKRVKK
jgi:hypothetical protein